MAKTAKKGIGIKYEDKSAGQPDLGPIFARIKELLDGFQKESLRLRGGEGGQVLLISEKAVVIDGRKKEELWFASALVQKGYVGFYYMPVYMNETVRSQLKPELLKCLKGKACFHIKKNDPLLFDQIGEALEIGYKCYKKMGWI
jgi:hypothetical protein